jgi:hypothetical protein
MFINDTPYTHIHIQLKLTIVFSFERGEGGGGNETRFLYLCISPVGLFAFVIIVFDFFLLRFDLLNFTV